MAYASLGDAHDEAKAARLTSARCLYGLKCPLKLRCCFKHTQQEIAYFAYYGDYDGDSYRPRCSNSCSEPACLHFKECICMEMDHPHYIANLYSDSESESDEHHGDSTTGDYANTAYSWFYSDYNGPSSDYSSGDDADPAVDIQYWKEGGWSDFFVNRDWAMSTEEGTYGSEFFQTDDGMNHCVPKLQYIGLDHVQTADRFGETYYVNLNMCTSTYLDPRGYDSATEERYRDCPAPSVLVR